MNNINRGTNAINILYPIYYNLGSLTDFLTSPRNHKSFQILETNTEK